MAVRKRRWTADENERLKALVSEGVSVIKVAAALKRTTVVSALRRAS
jgi:hypothetical protein